MYTGWHVWFYMYRLRFIDIYEQFNSLSVYSWFVSICFVRTIHNCNESLWCKP